MVWFASKWIDGIVLSLHNESDEYTSLDFAINCVCVCSDVYFWWEMYVLGGCSRGIYIVKGYWVTRKVADF